MNRVIKKNDLDMICITGPGHGGPGLVANTYLESTYSEVSPNISCDEEGMKRLFTQFSFPGGIPSHVAPETPGSIHEGGELGYALSHAYGAAFDNPDLIVACVVGDGEAETGRWQRAGMRSVRRREARDFVPFDLATDYRLYVDGKPRFDGVRDFLTSRGIQLPEGNPDDPPQVETVGELGNRKNDLVPSR